MQLQIIFWRAWILAIVVSAAASSVAAQDNCPCPPPAPPEPAWKGGVGVGLALTGGNSDTQSLNLTFSAVHDPKRKNLFRAEGLYLRSDTDGEATVDKSTLGLRDEYQLGPRAFVFGEARYLRDVFKQIDYLVSPLAGLGLKLADSDKAKLSIDAAAGGQFESDKGRKTTSDGAVQAGERLTLKLSPTATLSERGSALWKMSNFEDGLYHFDVGISASMSKRTELKLAFIDDYKTRPPGRGLKKNDTSIVAALVFKIG